MLGRHRSRDLIESSRAPYVIADRVTENLSADTVSVDNEDASTIEAPVI